MHWALWTLTIVMPLALGVETQEYTAKEDIIRSIPFPGSGASRTLAVDNIRGSIDVVGYDGDKLELVAHRTSYGDTEEKLEEAKKNITLDVSQDSGRIVLYVRTPWRYENSSGSHIHEDDEGYDAEFNFELKVPSRTDCILKTVNGGSISVSGMTGTFEVRNVNGGIAMTRIAGSGSAKTVNGNVKVDFRENPASRCGFATINGSIDVTLDRNLSADFRFKTFNGEVYSDFEFTGLPHDSPSSERFGRRTVYHGNDYTRVRAGNGGPRLDFETLNGDIHILKNHQ
ncbi:MAG TPA: hypothetical protein VMG09_14965 [Bacteroidota bacterium]|nr:hypothetical protein [Bacteroidota bacterium]